MREFIVKRTFEAPAAELFERATEDARLEQRLLSLTHKKDIDVSEWTKLDTHTSRVIAYVIPSVNSLGLSDLAKSSDLQMSKFQDTFSNKEKNQFVIDFKLFYGQTQAVSDVRVVLQHVSDSSADCTVVIKNICKNQLIRGTLTKSMIEVHGDANIFTNIASPVTDHVEASMEENLGKDMNLWLDLLWELQAAYKVTPVAKVVETLPPPQSPSTTPSLRPMTAKSYTWSTHDLHELGEIEEMKVLNGGLSNLADELDTLRRTVESHYVRLCSLESHLTSQSLVCKQPPTSDSSTANCGPILDSHSATASSSEQLLVSSQPGASLAFNSLEELEARQRTLRLQLTGQMQSIEKSFLKQQQASQQLKTLESRWESMLDKMSKRLQEIDTLRYGLLGSWRYSVSILCFIIFWPLIVRYFWITYGRNWARKIAMRLAWKRAIVAKVPIAPAALSLSNAVASTAPIIQAATNMITPPGLVQAATSAMSSPGLIQTAASAMSSPSLIQAASSAISAITNAATNVSAGAHPVLSRLTPQNFWR